MVLAGWEAGDGVTRWPSQIVHAVPLAAGVAAGAARLAAGLAAFAADGGGVHLGGNPQQAQVRQPEGYRCARAMRSASLPETLGRGIQVRG